jgi:hypothetical protein
MFIYDLILKVSIGALSEKSRAPAPRTDGAIFMPYLHSDPMQGI